MVSKGALLYSDCDCLAGVGAAAGTEVLHLAIGKGIIDTHEQDGVEWSHVMDHFPTPSQLQELPCCVVLNDYYRPGVL